MNHARSSFLALIVLAFLSVTATGGDYAALNFIGFSKDGKYLAFEEYGVQDGSGFPYSNIYVIDVIKNLFAVTPVNVRIEKETATEALARSRAKFLASRALKRYAIAQGNTGTLAVARMLNDLTLSDSGVDKKAGTQKINFAEIVASMYRRGDYELVLKSTEVKVKDCDYTDQPAYKLELTLKDKDADKTIVLQRDSTLPASRSCPIEYAIQFVYLYEDSIAVFLNTYTIGFEGPDMRYLAVTGKFK